MTLTVLIRDEGPIRFLDMPAGYRTIRFDLTPEQAAQINLAPDEVLQISVLDGEQHEWRKPAAGGDR